MVQDSPQYTSLSQVQSDLLSGKISCRALVDDYLNRINTHQHLNAYLEVFEQEAREQADATDQILKSGKSPGSLFGLVLAIKDNICYAGHVCSASSRILGGFRSLFTATALQRLIDEGAIVIGRTNCDEFAMGSSNENSAYGLVRNAADMQRVPGGSSGGSAVAVQAGLCLASLGSDTGGSIRQPAAFCGLTGFKPTYGRVSRYGLIAYASSFDQIGPFTHQVEDAELITAIMSGFDPKDATSSSQEVKTSSGEAKISGMRIGIPAGMLDAQLIQPEIYEHFMKTIDALKSRGAEVKEMPFSLMPYLIPAYYVLTTAEASSNLSRYDGVHFGYRSPQGGDMESIYKRSRTEGFGKEVKNRIMLGTFVLSSGYYDAYYTRAQKVRRLIRDQIEAMYQECDYLLMPCTPSVAFRFGEKTDDPVAMYLSDAYTVLANLSGMPAISIPAGKDREGMPFGIQLMGKAFDEPGLFGFSKKLSILVSEI